MAKKEVPVSNEVGPIDSKEETCKRISVNALRTMTDTLVEMEQLSLSEKEMMNKCVWPILNEAAKRFKDVQEGNKYVELGNFVYVVGK
jgi:hypothetical protein